MHTGFLLLSDQVNPRQNGLLRLVIGHGRAESHICRSIVDPARKNTRPGHKISDSHIHRYYPAVGQCCHAANIALSRRQLAGHNAGHFAAGLGNALGYHTVISAQNQHRPRGEPELFRSDQRCHIRHHIFQKAQAAQRFCAGIPALPCSVRRVFHRRTDGS